jgi:hypothetical protein
MQWRWRIKAGIPKIRLNLKARIWKGTVGDMRPETRAHNTHYGNCPTYNAMRSFERSGVAPGFDLP